MLFNGFPFYLQTNYASLSDEVKIGDYYLRLLLQETESTATPIHNPYGSHIASKLSFR